MFGVQRVKKIRNFAFVHFFCPADAQKAYEHFKSKQH